LIKSTTNIAVQYCPSVELSRVGAGSKPPGPDALLLPPMPTALTNHEWLTLKTPLVDPVHDGFETRIIRKTLIVIGDLVVWIRSPLMRPISRFPCARNIGTFWKIAEAPIML